MKSLTYQEFFSQPPTRGFHACYLITGKDGFLIDRTYTLIRESIKCFLDKPDIVTIYGDEITIPDLSDYLESYSIFASNRILIIRNAERLGEENKTRKNPERHKKMADIIGKYLETPDPSQAIILIAESVDSRLTGWKKIKEIALQIECHPPKHAGEMRAWLDAILKEKQIRMDNTARELFMSKVELDFCTAENELTKLCILIGERKVISETDVKTTLPSARAGTVSDFFRALGNRQTKDVLAKTDEMLASDKEPLMLLATITNFFKTIWKIHALKAKHISLSEISSKHLMDLFMTQRNEYISYTNHYKPSEIPAIFTALLELDSQIKLSMAEPEVLFTLCLMKICHAA